MSDSKKAASERVRAAIASGEPIRFISTQLVMIFFILFMAATSAAALVNKPSALLIVGQAALFTGALVTAIVSYATARRKSRLFAMFPILSRDYVLAPLTRQENRSLSRQLRGKEPIPEDSRDLVAAIVEYGRGRNQAAWPTLAACFLALVAVAIRFGWLLVIPVIAVAVFISVVSRVENARWKRALRDGPQQHAIREAP